MIIDTNALSAVAEGIPALEGILSAASQLAVPVIVLGEYRYGIRQSRNRQGYEDWLVEFLPTCRVLNVTDDTATSYASIRSDLKKAGTPIPSNDLWIAALSRQHSLPILSRDLHFDAVRGMKRIAW